jgi:hypothetical protein
MKILIPWKPEENSKIKVAAELKMTDAECRKIADAVERVAAKRKFVEVDGRMYIVVEQPDEKDDFSASMTDEEKRAARIAAFLDWENKDEILEDAVEVCRRLVEKEPRRAEVVSSKLSTIVSAAVSSLHKESMANWNGMEKAAVAHQCGDDSNERIMLYGKLPVMKQLFPDGHTNLNSCCPATKEYFESWREVFLKSDLASGLETEHKSWAIEQGYLEFLIKVKKNAGPARRRNENG